MCEEEKLRMCVTGNHLREEVCAQVCVCVCDCVSSPSSSLQLIKNLRPVSLAVYVQRTTAEFSFLFSAGLKGER